MSTNTDTPLSAPELEELERLATEAQKELDEDSREHHAPTAVNSAVGKIICRELRAYCTPERITRLLTAVRRGGEDTRDAGRYREIRENRALRAASHGAHPDVVDRWVDTSKALREGRCLPAASPTPETTNGR